MMFNQMIVNSEVFEIEKLNLKVGFFKNCTLIIEIFLKGLNK